ncbi:MAG: response regulator transcription factor [Ktedonobacteraceae bacterium]|nr:response regulator transcription factor [Ktedonobacteraceae bacterium]
MKLLLVDTDRDLIEMLSSWLKTVGYEVHRAYTLERAERVWEEQEPDLVIIETAMDDEEGLALCHTMRTTHDTLVLALTEAADSQDEIRCLESGVDSYLRKPFLPGQLLAHIHALSRRGRSAHTAPTPSILTIGPIRIDAVSSKVSINGKTEYLTPIENKLLRFLAINANNVCTGNQIVSHIWGFSNYGDTRLIKAHIQHLRQKIEKDPNNPAYLLTVRGVGYSLVHRSSEEYDTREVTRALQAAM